MAHNRVWAWLDHPKDCVIIDDLALSTLWAIAALVKLLGRKGILTRIEVLAMIQELRQREHTGIPPRRLRVEASTPPVDTSQSTAQPAIPASC